MQKALLGSGLPPYSFWRPYASTDPHSLLWILERGLEDHESVAEVQAAWPIGGDSRFVFRKNFAKYELFKSNPVSLCAWGPLPGTPSISTLGSVPHLVFFLSQHSLFPEKMVSSCLDVHTDMSHEDLIQVRGLSPLAHFRIPSVPLYCVLEGDQSGPK